MTDFQRIHHRTTLEPLIRQIENHPELWNQHPLRTKYTGTVHSDSSDIWIKYNDVNAKDLIDEMFNGKNAINYPAFYVLSGVYGLLSSLMQRVRGERLGRVLVTKLPPGGKILPHIDEGETSSYYDRFHIVLSEGGYFSCGKSKIKMRFGEIWWFNNQKTHSVENDSENDRIHLIVDIRLAEFSPCWSWKDHKAGGI